MVASTFPSAMSHIRRDEGGYVNHPMDPGGAINFGATQSVYDTFRKRRRFSIRSVKLISEDEVSTIYKTQYADKVRYDDLPAGVDYATFDAAVNSGVSRGPEWLQVSVGAAADSVIGNLTVAKAKAADPVATVKAICARRLSFVRGLWTWTTFGKGWSRRIAGVVANGVAMALKSGGMSARGLAAVTKAESKRAATSAKTQATAARSSIVPAASASGTAGVAYVNTATIVVLSLIAIGLVAFGVYLSRKASINRDRAAAYAAIAQGVTS
jgi:lysozyme family protein